MTDINRAGSRDGREIIMTAVKSYVGEKRKRRKKMAVAKPMQWGQTISNTRW